MDLSLEDKDLLKALANLYNAVDIAAVIKACEAFRESAFRQRDRLAIGADTLRLFAQTRGKSIDLETKEWQEFFRLAKILKSEERGNERAIMHAKSASASFVFLHGLRYYGALKPWSTIILPTGTSRN